ncbi:YceI family protein [Sulfurimonas sp.]|uniref:YceI family protein n=1 Tax=Sulfurimonas sp. TaxID=2022749 RepID=UPI00356A32D4
MNLLRLGLVSVLVAGSLFAGNYNVDVTHSNVSFKVKHMMISNVTGKFDKFKGNFVFDEKTKTLKSLYGEVEAASVNTENEKRDTHLRSADFFDVTKYPTLTLELTDIGSDEATGKLTIHGITKLVKFELETTGVIKDPWGNQRTGLSLEAKVNRQEFGLKWNDLLESGGLIVDDKVKIFIELEGILTK